MKSKFLNQFCFEDTSSDRRPGRRANPGNYIFITNVQFDKSSALIDGLYKNGNDYSRRTGKSNFYNKVEIIKDEVVLKRMRIEFITNVFENRR